MNDRQFLADDPGLNAVYSLSTGEVICLLGFVILLGILLLRGRE